MIYFNENQAINFKHTRIEDRRVTVCQIINVDNSGNELVVSEGASMCNPRDNFCKEYGRKLSLTKALRMTQLDKNQRKVVWDAYFNR